MFTLSKDAVVVCPTEDREAKRLIQAKYLIFRDMAQSQVRYRSEIDASLNPE
jgi:hypothetical protein